MTKPINNLIKNSCQIFLLCCALFAGSSLWANDTIRFNWRDKPDRKIFAIRATEGKTFTVNWGNGKKTTYTGLGTSTDIYCEHKYSSTNSYAVNITGNTADCFFTTLYCSDNQLITLDVSKAKALKALYCHGELTSLNVSQNTALKTLDCSRASLKTLDVSKNAKLTTLNCSNNTLSTLDVSKNSKLTDLDCSWNRLTSLDVSKNSKLTTLNCSWNRLTMLNVSKNAKLTDLSFFSNQLTALDVSQNTALKTLGCSSTQLSTLDISQNTALTHLNCSENKFTTLDISKNTALTYLSCYGNGLSLADLKNASDKKEPLYNKELGTQTLPSATVAINTAVAVDTVFNGKNTVFKVSKLEGETELNTELNIDYSVTNGFITFKTSGFYRVKITNPEITCHYFPAEVIAFYTVEEVEK